jgi:hypothetical protein
MILVTRLVPYSAMALYPFILVKHEKMKEDKELIHHEKIHHRQQLELLLLGFYIIYGAHYLFNLIKYKEHFTAYKQIVFEREAYAMDKDLDYLSRRKIFAFLNF